MGTLQNLSTQELLEEVKNSQSDPKRLKQLYDILLPKLQAEQARKESYRLRQEAERLRQEAEQQRVKTQRMREEESIQRMRQEGNRSGARLNFTNVKSKSGFGQMSNTNKYLLAIGVLILIFVLYKNKKLPGFSFGKRIRN